MSSRLKNQPKYKIGETCLYKVETEDKLTGLNFSHDIECFICSIKASGTSEKDTYEYGLTLDLPGCYHTGKSIFIYIFEDMVRIVQKVQDE